MAVIPPTLSKFSANHSPSFDNQTDNPHLHRSTSRDGGTEKPSARLRHFSCSGSGPLNRRYAFMTSFVVPYFDPLLFHFDFRLLSPFPAPAPAPPLTFPLSPLQPPCLLFNRVLRIFSARLPPHDQSRQAMGAGQRERRSPLETQ